MLRAREQAVICVACDAQAQMADEKAEATEQAVQRVRATADWLQTQSFLPPSETRRWHKLVCHAR